MDDIAESYGVFIDGEYRDGVEQFEVYNPATNEPLASVAEAGQERVEEAITNSQRALEEWRDVDPVERGRLLRDFAKLLREENDRLVRIETAENGRPLSQSEVLVRKAPKYFDYFAGLTDKIEGKTIPIDGTLDYTVREPLGVTGHIIPWNAAVNLGARSIAPALACGNTVVAKPSPEGPLSILELGELAVEAGIPPGVVNVVPGDGPRTGAALTDDSRLGKIVFTGSRATGKEVMRSAADHVVPVSLELGGKSPSIVFPDADLERAASDSLNAFWMAGQICHACTRVFVHEEIYDEFTHRLVDRAESMTIGPGVDDPDLGPLITEKARDRVARYVDRAVDDEATLLTGGSIPREEGNYYAPTLVEDVDDDAPLSCEEVFGPLLSLYPFSSESSVIRRANDTVYGLYATVWTNHLTRAHRVTSALEAGTVGINEYPATSVEAPFGGYKESGLSREKGRQAIDEYTQVKNIAISMDN